MPEKTRLSVCGFDPMIVKGYVKTGARALWFYLPDDLWKEYKVAIGDKIQGKLLAVYNPKGEKTHEPNEKFEWHASKETGYAILIPADIIVKYKLTEFHFLEMDLKFVVSTEKGLIEIYPGETKQTKWWPEAKMKLSYSIPYAE